MSACNEQTVHRLESCVPVINMEIGESASWLFDDGKTKRSIFLEQVSEGRIDVSENGQVIELSIINNADCPHYQPEAVVDDELKYLLYGEMPFDAVARRVLDAPGVVQGQQPGYDAQQPVDQNVVCEQP